MEVNNAIEQLPKKLPMLLVAESVRFLSIWPTNDPSRDGGIIEISKCFCGDSMTTRYVTKHKDGWQIKAPNAKRASTVTDTQKEAIVAAKEFVKNAGGGEVKIQGKDGKFRDADTVVPGNDPEKSKG